MIANAVEAARTIRTADGADIATLSVRQAAASWRRAGLLFCDEGAMPSDDARCAGEPGWTNRILTGPEGGLDPAERACLARLAVRRSVTLAAHLPPDTAACGVATAGGGPEFFSVALSYTPSIARHTSQKPAGRGRWLWSSR